MGGELWCLHSEGSTCFRSLATAQIFWQRWRTQQQAGVSFGCDLMNLYLVFDEYSDVEDAAGVQRQADSIMDALRNPHKPRPAGEWVGGEIFRQ